MTEYCIHIANFFYLASFLNRDMLWLRLLTCAGLVFGIVFFCCCASPMYGPAGWHAVFLVINVYQIWRLIEERRTTDLSRSKQLVSEKAVADLTREELGNVLASEITGNLDRRRDLKVTAHQELTDEEQVVKQMVIERLTRKEIVNLLARRMWGPILRRFKRSRSRE